MAHNKNLACDVFSAQPHPPSIPSCWAPYKPPLYKEDWGVKKTFVPTLTGDTNSSSHVGPL